MNLFSQHTKEKSSEINRTIGTFFYKYILNLVGNQPKLVNKPSSKSKAFTTNVTRSNSDMSTERRSSTAVKVINPVQPNKNIETRKRGASDTKEITTEKKAKVIDIKSEPDIFDIKMVNKFVLEIKHLTYYQWRSHSKVVRFCKLLNRS